MSPLTSQRPVEEIVHLSMLGKGVGELLGKEWLLTNRRGSYAASTVIGCNTSGYHGLLTGSVSPLVNRVVALSGCLETVVCGQQAFQFSTFEFGDKLIPTGYAYLREFWRDTGVHFLYDLNPIEVHKAIYLARESDSVIVEYTFRNVSEPTELLLRPFAALRDFHGLQKSSAKLTCRPFDWGVLVRHEAGGGELLICCPTLRFHSDPQWWFNFTYPVNRARGLDGVEDLWAPGIFRGRITSASRVVFQARFGEHFQPGEGLLLDAESVKADLADHQGEVIRAAGAQSRIEKVLSLAADQFIVTRGDPAAERVSIVAGYPWFADWGRDAFIALPGLLLTTGRHDEARSVLNTFAAAAGEGMIPNVFDDHTGTAHFNSVDASLWFIRAAFKYLDATGDLESFSREMLPAIRWIIESYHNGTRFGIRADSDGLIAAGDPETQLTWMDARYDGITFTPRYGKAVEVNALWHSVLCRMKQLCERQGLPGAGRYAQMAAKVGDSFAKVFWNEERGYLNDTVMLDGSNDTSLRPNQVFAVSLAYGPPLSRQQQRTVVHVVEGELLTPYGLRTLDRHNASYHGRYEGSPRERDEAYHQGTVWPWLMGPFVEAYLKVHDFSVAARRKASQMLEPLVRHATEDGCLGSLCEIFDGDPPHRPVGCFAQAWSVGELFRAYRMTAQPPAAGDLRAK
jgi:predicted glycogen debranching enzyme